jgi:hypothetical protein
VALYYQTEYRLGGRVGRISRSYTGVHALLAIVLDLFLGFVFGLVSIVIGLALRTVVIALQLSVIVLKASWRFLAVVMTAIVFCVTLPFALLHHAVDRQRSRMKSKRSHFPTVSPLKPEWALSREV